jgi:hypothetical protein
MRGYRYLAAVAILTVCASRAQAVHPNPGTNLDDFTVLAGGSVSAGTIFVVDGGGLGLSVAGSPGRTGATLGTTNVVSNPGGNTTIGTVHLAELAALKTALNGLTPSPSFDFTGLGEIPLDDTDFGAGVGVLVPGVYRFDALSIAGGGGFELVFNGVGEYVLNIAGDLETSTPLQMSLANSASPADIFWNVSGQVKLGAGNVIMGHLLAQSGVVGLSPGGVSIRGKVMTLSGGITFPGATTVSVSDAGFPPNVLVNGAAVPQPGTALSALADENPSTDLGYTVSGGDPEAGGSPFTLVRLSVSPPSAAAAFESPGSSGPQSNTATLSEEFDPDSALANGTPAGSRVTVGYRSIDQSRAVTEFQVNIHLLVSPDIAVSPAPLDFGLVPPFGSQVRTLQILNTAEPNGEPLTVSSILSSDPAVVVSALDLPVVIGAGADVLVPITFTPPDSGPFSANLTILSDDPNESPLVVPISATVDAATSVDLDAPPFLEFPATVVGKSTERTLTLSNSGDVVMRVNLSVASGANYALVNGPASGFVLIGTGSVKTLTVRFSPTSVDREVTDTLNLSLVDPLAPGVVFGTDSVDLCGEGVLQGARVLATSGGAPLASVRKIILQRKGGGGWANVAQAGNVPLTEILRPPCSPVRFHLERALQKAGRYRFVVTQGGVTKRPEFTFSQGQFVEVVAAF